MATISEDLKSREGSGEGLNATRYSRKIRVLLDASDLPTDYDTLTHVERENVYPSITGMVRALYPWAHPHPWNAAALATSWVLETTHNPMHHVVRIGYEIGILNPGFPGLPPGWDLSVSSGLTNEPLLQELPDQSVRSSRFSQINGVQSPHSQFLRIIGPPKMLASDTQTQRAVYKYLDGGKTVYLEPLDKRIPIGFQRPVPVARIFVTKIASGMPLDTIGKWVDQLGDANSHKFLGAKPHHIMFASMDCTPVKGETDVNTRQPGTRWDIKLGFEWRKKPFTPHDQLVHHATEDGSKVIVTRISDGEPVVESFKVAETSHLMQALQHV